MKVTSAQFGRVFVVRLEDGDVLHECIETVARREKVSHGVCFFVGGADTDSTLSMGPEE